VARATCGGGDARGSDARGARGKSGGRWKVRKVKPRAEAAPRKGNEGDAFVDELLDRGNPTRIRFSREPFRESAAGVCCQGSNLESRVHFFRPRFLSLSLRTAARPKKTGIEPATYEYFFRPRFLSLSLRIPRRGRVFGDRAKRLKNRGLKNIFAEPEIPGSIPGTVPVGQESNSQPSGAKNVFFRPRFLSLSLRIPRAPGFGQESNSQPFGVALVSASLGRRFLSLQHHDLENVSPRKHEARV
jgi:hypothetical protein